MKATFKSIAAKGIVVGIAAAALCMTAPASAWTVMEGDYNLYDHPDAALTGPGVSYGLRYDSYDSYGSAASRTWSLEDGYGNSIAWLSWDVATKTATIFGKLRHNSDNSLWDINYVMTDLMPTCPTCYGTAGFEPDDLQYGWYTHSDYTNGYNGIGTLSLGTYVIELKGKNDANGVSFEFDNDGHRCYSHVDPCDPTRTDETVGRGWLKPGYSTNDWLFVAKKKPDQPPPGVSEPGSLALFGLGLIGFGYVRRRRAAATPA